MPVGKNGKYYMNPHVMAAEESGKPTLQKALQKAFEKIKQDQGPDPHLPEIVKMMRKKEA